MAEKTFERTPKDLIIGIAMTLCGGVLWGVNATVSKILMGTYHASPLWIACVRELAAGRAIIAAASPSSETGDRVRCRIRNPSGLLTLTFHFTQLFRVLLIPRLCSQ